MALIAGGIVATAQAQVKGAMVELGLAQAHVTTAPEAAVAILQGVAEHAATGTSYLPCLDRITLLEAVATIKYGPGRGIPAEQAIPLIDSVLGQLNDDACWWKPCD